MIADDGKTELPAATTWVQVDACKEVREGLVPRDAIYRLIHEGSVRVARVSSRKWLIPTTWLDELATAEKSPDAGGAA